MIRALPVPLILPRLRPLAVASAIGIASLVVLILRRAEAVTRPQFYAEEGPVFYVPTFFHDALSLLATPYGGYLVVGQRLAAQVERAVVPAAAPAVGALLSLAVVVGIAAFIASDRLANVMPQRWVRLSLAAMVILNPSSQELLGHSVNLQWYGAIYLAALSLARPAETLAWRAVDVVAAVIAGLSGPLSIVLMPLFLVRRSWLSCVVVGCAVIQIAILLNGPGRVLQIPDMATVIDVVSLRVNTAVLGPTIGRVTPGAVAALLVLLGGVVVIRASQRRVWATLGYGALVCGGAGVLAEGAGLIVHPLWGERYFSMAALAVAALIVAGLASRDRIARRISMALGVVVLAGVVIDFDLPAFRDARWASQSACIGSSEPCTIEGMPPDFRIQWPGASGDYPIPTTFGSRGGPPP